MKRCRIQYPPQPLSDEQLRDLGLMRTALSLYRGVLVVPSTITLSRLARVVADHHGISVDELRGQRVFARFVWARQEFCWIAHRRRGLSLPRIAMYLGYADHTGVWHGVRQHEARLDAGCGLGQAA